MSLLSSPSTVATPPGTSVDEHTAPINCTMSDSQARLDTSSPKVIVISFVGTLRAHIRNCLAKHGFIRSYLRYLCQTEAQQLKMVAEDPTVIGEAFSLNVSQSYLHNHTRCESPNSYRYSRLPRVGAGARGGGGRQPAVKNLCNASLCHNLHGRLCDTM